MSKKIFFCAAALCAALLAGCGDSREENSTVKQQNNMFMRTHRAAGRRSLTLLWRTGER